MFYKKKDTKNDLPSKEENRNRGVDNEGKYDLSDTDSFESFGGTKDIAMEFKKEEIKPYDDGFEEDYKMSLKGF